MDIGIIGAGKVGCSMGKYMKEHGLPVAGYFSRSSESSEEAGTFTNTTVFYQLSDIIKKCDILCIATPDDVIGSVWKEILELSKPEKTDLPTAEKRTELGNPDLTKSGNPGFRALENKILCHFSGSLSSDVFSGTESVGAFACSVHPMYAFSDKFTSYRQLNHVFMTMEGDERAVCVMEKLFSDMGNPVLKIRPEQKALYHCSASLVSNHMIGLYQLGLDLLERCGIERATAEQLLGSLVSANTQAMLEKGPEKALTGPIERGDVQTVKKHLSVLEEDEAALYRMLSQKVLEAARKKNPTKNYEEMAFLLDEKCEQ
jgi:hypothetical protein